MKTIKWALVLLLTALLISCSKTEVAGRGEVTSENRALANFASLNAKGYYNINITIGTPQSVSIKADSNLLPLIQTKVSGQALTVETKNGYILRPQATPTLDIVVPSLREINLSGKNRALVKKVEEQDLKLNFSGSNEMSIQGNLSSLSVQSSGQTNLDAFQLWAKEVSIDSDGTAQIKVNAKDKLKIKAQGTGTITYAGNPSIDQSINGSVTIAKAQETITK